MQSAAAGARAEGERTPYSEEVKTNDSVKRQ